MATWRSCSGPAAVRSSCCGAPMDSTRRTSRSRRAESESARRNGEAGSLKRRRAGRRGGGRSSEGASWEGRGQSGYEDRTCRPGVLRAGCGHVQAKHCVHVLAAQILREEGGVG
eukprot:66439-Chlamydomonas_euryale.AAC.2